LKSNGLGQGVKKRAETTASRPAWPRLRLAKLGLCLLIGGAALFGGLLAEPRLSSSLFATSLAVVALAAAAASLNSLQEHRLDQLMTRTLTRPLPQGEMSRQEAFRQALLLGAAGFGALFFFAGGVATALAALALLLYNGVYTPLKPKTAWAIIPGALCGALPPLIGWQAMGGALWSYPAGLLAALLVLWQLPHFWLVLLANRLDYRRVGLPNVVELFGEKRVKAFFLPWLAALATVMLLFLTLPQLSQAAVSGLAIAVLLNAAGILMVFAWELLQESSNYRLLFFALNFALTLHMGLIGVACLLR
jgi:heme o synthase